MQTGEGTTEGRRLPSPAMVLALAALIAALAGTAVAVDKITSKDIAKKAVRSKHIKDGQVKAKDADFVTHRRAGTLNLSGIGRVNAGPAITVRAKAGSLLHVMARVTAAATVGTGNCWVGLGVQGGGDDDETPADAIRFAGPDPTARWMSPFDSPGTFLRGFAGGRTIPVSRAGRYRIALSYYADLEDTSCTFSDRNLWVEQVR